MNRIKAGVVAVAGTAVGLLTLRALRRRRADPREEAETAAGDALSEARTAADHTVSAAGHARVAAKKSVEYVQQELELGQPTVGDADETDSPGPVRRLRKVGKGWLR